LVAHLLELAGHLGLETRYAGSGHQRRYPEGQVIRKRALGRPLDTDSRIVGNPPQVHVEPVLPAEPGEEGKQDGQQPTRPAPFIVAARGCPADTCRNRNPELVVATWLGSGRIPIGQVRRLDGQQAVRPVASIPFLCLFPLVPLVG
jgi:hypothetical protein